MHFLGAKSANCRFEKGTGYVGDVWRPVPDLKKGEESYIPVRLQNKTNARYMRQVKARNCIFVVGHDDAMYDQDK